MVIAIIYVRLFLFFDTFRGLLFDAPRNVPKNSPLSLGVASRSENIPNTKEEEPAASEIYPAILAIRLNVPIPHRGSGYLSQEG